MLEVGHPAAFRQQLRWCFGRACVEYQLKVTGDFPVEGQQVDPFNATAAHGPRGSLDANNGWKNLRKVVGSIQRMRDLCAAVEELLRAGDYEGCRAFATQ